MTKSISAGMTTHLALNNTTLTTCVKMKRTDGVIFGFTEHDLDIPFDLGDGDGTITYLGNTSFNRTAIRTSGDLAVDNLDIEAVFDSSALTALDVRAGLFDKTEVKFFMLDWTAPTVNGAIKLRMGYVGEIRSQDETYTGEIRGLMQLYSQRIVELATPDCRADLGDLGHTFGPNQNRCTVQLLPTAWAAGLEAVVRGTRDARAPAAGSPTQVNVVRPSTFNDRHFKCTTAGITGAGSPTDVEPTWNTAIGATTADGDIVWTAIQALTIEGSVINVNDKASFTIAYIGDAPDALFTGGLLTWGSGSPGGSNEGLTQEVKAWSLDGGSPTLSPTEPKIELFLPMPFDVQPGDTFTISAGCDKLRPTCRDTFDNILNFQGEPDVPGNDTFARGPS